MNKIKIFINDLAFEGELNDEKIAKEIYEALPIEAQASFWGEEIYFGVPVRIIQENLTEKVSIGDLAYWPEGNSFCIFYGKTPASVNGEPKPISPITIIGKITKGDIKELKPLTEAQVKINKQEIL